MEDGRPVTLDKHFTFDDVTYTVTPFAPTRALKLQIRLAKIVGPAVAEMAKVGDGKDGVDPGQRVLEILPHAVAQLVKGMADTDEVIKLIKDIMECVTKERKPISFEIEFHGKMGLMVKLLRKAIEVNFEDFFRALSDSMGDAAGA